MNFTEIAENRQSCRSYDPERIVEQEKLDKILESARLATVNPTPLPSAAEMRRPQLQGLRRAWE